MKELLIIEEYIKAMHDGTPVDFRCCTDSHAHVKSYCIAGIPTNDKYFYWKKIDDFELPDAVAKAFGYKTGNEP